MDNMIRVLAETRKEILLATRELGTLEDNHPDDADEGDSEDDDSGVHIRGRPQP